MKEVKTLDGIIKEFKQAYEIEKEFFEESRSSFYEAGYKAYNRVYKTLEEYKDNNKLVIPECLDDFIQLRKKMGCTDIIGCLVEDCISHELSEQLYEYYTNNSNLCYRAILEEDYVVEKRDKSELKFKVGDYYYNRDVDYCTEIFKVTDIYKELNGTYSFRIDSYISYDKDTSPAEFIKHGSFNEESNFALTVRKATDEDIQLFKVAYMYHKHNRFLGELKVNDIIEHNNGHREVLKEYSNFYNCHKCLLEGHGILYLTVEELESTYKRGKYGN